MSPPKRAKRCRWNTRNRPVFRGRGPVRLASSLTRRHCKPRPPAQTQPLRRSGPSTSKIWIASPLHASGRRDLGRYETLRFGRLGGPSLTRCGARRGRRLHQRQRSSRPPAGACEPRSGRRHGSLSGRSLFLQRAPSRHMWAPRRRSELALARLEWGLGLSILYQRIARSPVLVGSEV